MATFLVNFALLFAATTMTMAASPHPKKHVSALQSPDIPAGTSIPQDMWYTQNVDHFDFTLGTFRQRYQMNASFYKPNGPVFLMLGGEGPATGEWLAIDTAIMLYAKRYG